MSGLTRGDMLVLVEAAILRTTRKLRVLRARRLTLAPEKRVSTGPRFSQHCFEVNGGAIRPTLREAKVLELLVAAGAAGVAPLGMVDAIYDGSARWRCTALCRLNAKLRGAGARVETIKGRGCRLLTHENFAGESHGAIGAGVIQGHGQPAETQDGAAA